MNVFLACLCFAGGYAASVFSWDTVKTFFLSADTLLKAAEAKLAALKAKV